MILKTPVYLKDFNCIADRCKDNCCIGWEIDIDNKTAEYYESIDGEFGDRLKKCITSEIPKSFILDKNERCPFLNNKNLCDIIINLGEEHICNICTEHPRYYEWFNGVKEGGIGLCCEESARIILSQKGSVEYTETQIQDEPYDEYDAEYYEFLYELREKILCFIQNDEIPFKHRLCSILDYSEQLQYNADNGDFSIPDISSSFTCGKPWLSEILNFINSLEQIDDDWTSYFSSCIDMFDMVSKRKKEFEKANPETEHYLKNIAVYFIWRYFLKGVFNEEFLSYVKITAVSVIVCEYLMVCHWLKNDTLSLDDCAEIAKRYSKEVEYCEENMDKLADATYQLKALSSSSIIADIMK